MGNWNQTRTTTQRIIGESAGDFKKKFDKVDWGQ
jgi:hypothetical protein